MESGEILIGKLVLSRFDVRVGPKLFLNVPELQPHAFLEHVPLLLDFYEKGFFVHEFGEVKSSNLIFTVPSPVARGLRETLMISIIFENEEDMDPRSFQGLLELFVDELKEIKDLYKGFYKEEEDFEDSHQIYSKIVDLLNAVYQSFPKETISMKARDINLVVFDFCKEGKSQIAKILLKSISNGQFHKNKSKESSLLYSKISISEYSISVSNPLEFNKFLEFQLKNKDGFIFVVDVTNKVLFKIAELTLDLTFKRPEFTFKPSLILIDKKGTDRLEIQKLIKDLRVSEEENKIIKYILINTSENEDIRKAIKWIVEKITIIKPQAAI